LNRKKKTPPPDSKKQRPLPHLLGGGGGRVQYWHWEVLYLCIWKPIKKSFFAGEGRKGEGGVASKRKKSRSGKRMSERKLGWD